MSCEQQSGSLCCFGAAQASSSKSARNSPAREVRRSIASTQPHMRAICGDKADTYFLSSQKEATAGMRLGSLNDRRAAGLTSPGVCSSMKVFRMRRQTGASPTRSVDAKPIGISSDARAGATGRAGGFCAQKGALHRAGLSKNGCGGTVDPQRVACERIESRCTRLVGRLTLVSGGQYGIAKVRAHQGHKSHTHERLQTATMHDTSACTTAQAGACGSWAHHHGQTFCRKTRACCA